MSDWKELPLGEICGIEIGGTPSRSEERYWWKSDDDGIRLPWVSISDMKEKVIMETKESITEVGALQSNCKHVQKGTLLMSFKLTIGRLAFAGKDLYTNEAITAIRPNKDICPEFLYYGLQHWNLTGDSDQAVKGVTLNKQKLQEIPCLIPPLPEQTKIVEILSGIDRCIQAEVNIESKITKQYQGVLSRIFDDLSKEIPLGDYLPLGDLNLDLSDGNYSAKYPSAGEFVERGVPFIRASNMKEGTIDDKDMRFISATKHQEITKGHLKSGDILIANRGEIGKTSRVPARHIGSNINAQVVRINGGKKIDSSFLFHYLSSPFCQTLIGELTTGTALKQLPIGNLVKLLIPAPEMSVQIAIGGALDSMQRVMNAISEKSKKRSQLKQALATDLLSGRKRVCI